MRSPDTELLRRVLRRIERRPESWCQGLGAYTIETDVNSRTTYDLPAMTLTLFSPQFAYERIDPPAGTKGRVSRADYVWADTVSDYWTPLLDDFAVERTWINLETGAQHTRDAVHIRVAAQVILGLDVLSAGRLFSDTAKLYEIKEEVERLTFGPIDDRTKMITGGTYL